MGRLRRVVRLVVVVFAMGLGTPVVAGVVPGGTVQGGVGLTRVMHVHGVGEEHVARHGGGGLVAEHGSGRSAPCAGCLTDAACAVSCLGVAVLPVMAAWRGPGPGVGWVRAVVPVWAGVVPPGAMDPPRPGGGG